jgi:hypothetical protein
MIKLQVIGHLGKDCTTNVVSGKNVINFSVAHSEKFKDSMGNQKEKTTWVECACWAERTAIAPYLKKGQSVSFSFDKQGDDYRITAIAPMTGASASAADGGAGARR